MPTAKQSLADKPSPLHPEKKLGELTRPEMRQIVDRLPDEPEFHAGIVLLKSILNRDVDDKTAVTNFLTFVDKADDILDNTGKILRHDFKANPDDPPDSPYVLGHEKEMDGARPLASRRQFLRAGLRTGAWVGTGAVITLLGVAQTGNQITHYISPVPDDPQQAIRKARRNLFALIHDFIGDHLMGPVDTLLGAAIFNEGLENWEELKFEQISNGVTEFLQTVGAYENKKPPTKKTTRRSPAPPR